VATTIKITQVVVILNTFYVDSNKWHPHQVAPVWMKYE